MHSLNHPELARAIAADRVRASSRARQARNVHRAPPVRGHAAWVVGRAARRLDAESARRAVA